MQPRRAPPVLRFARLFRRGSRQKWRLARACPPRPCPFRCRLCAALPRSVADCLLSSTAARCVSPRLSFRRRRLAPLSLACAATVAAQSVATGCVSLNGQASSSACSTSSGSCSTSTPGSTYSAVWSGSWTDGVFAGTLTANGCPHDTRAFQQSSVAIPWLTSTVSNGGGNTPTCCRTTWPISGYSSPPKAASTTGAVGYAMRAFVPPPPAPRCGAARRCLHQQRKPASPLPTGPLRWRKHLWHV